MTTASFNLEILSLKHFFIFPSNIRTKKWPITLIIITEIIMCKKTRYYRRFGKEKSVSDNAIKIEVNRSFASFVYHDAACLLIQDLYFMGNKVIDFK